MSGPLPSPALTAAERSPIATAALAVTLVAGVVALQGAILTAMGQPPICTCGVVRLWQGDVLSAENSQQIVDWYTPSHVIHGLLFYAAATLVLPRSGVLVRLAIALGIEVGWETLENSPPVIARYREQALANGYSGDSVINSLSDTLACTTGFWLARFLPSRATVALGIGLELFTGAMIRDNLTLNTLQLIYPSDSIARWQLEGQRAAR
ncbi:MAG: DUF2585 family protein [Bauldia sp.]